MDTIDLQSWGAIAAYRCITRSCRVGSEPGVELIERARDEKRPLILSFWHSRILGCVRQIELRLQQHGHPIKVLISRSRDGEIITRLLEHHGVTAARGSTSRGGGPALRSLVRYLEDEGGIVVTTPDGPRGPDRRVKPGTVLMARQAGVPIVPMSFAATRAWRLSSWDRFIVPKPFGRLEFVVGEPVVVAPDADEAAMEEARRELEEGIRRADRAAAELAGVEP